MNDSNIVKEIGRSYLVSAFLPAALFVSLAYLLFRGFVPAVIVKQITGNDMFLANQWVLLAMSIMWIGFYLFSASDNTVKFFEGYFIPQNWREKLVNWQKKGWEERVTPKFQEWLTKNDQLTYAEAEVTESQANELGRLWELSLQELAKTSPFTPLVKDILMPTRLGNVWRAIENYAYEHYHIEEITIWPRLLPVLPTEIVRHLEEKNNHFMFLLNSAFLLYLNAGISAIAAFIGLPIFMFPDVAQRWQASQKGFFFIGYDFISPLGYLLIALVFAGFGYMLYSVSVNVAAEFGMYICTSFDLYRFHLLKQLNLYVPESLDDERKLWREISQFIVANDRLGSIELLKYRADRNH